MARLNKNARGHKYKAGAPVLDGSIDAGLLCLAAVQPPGRYYDLKEIAHACGVSRQAIAFIEKNAMRKVRERLRRDLGLSEEEFTIENADLLPF